MVCVQQLNIRDKQLYDETRSQIDYPIGDGAATVCAGRQVQLCRMINILIANNVGAKRLLITANDKGFLPR
jgi:hypothetical protein